MYMYIQYSVSPSAVCTSVPLTLKKIIAPVSVDTMVLIEICCK